MDGGVTALLPDPILVEDAHEGWRRTRSQGYRDVVMAWMRSEGIRPEDTRRIEVYLVDTPFARVTSYVRENGGIVWNAHREEPEMAVETVLLRSLPPTS